MSRAPKESMRQVRDAAAPEHKKKAKWEPKSPPSGMQYFRGALIKRR